MEEFFRKISGIDRHRGITEKSKALLFLLRETPYITLADAKRFFYPTHKTLSYAREMIRVLFVNNLVLKYRLGDGLFIYYLTATGKRVTEFYLEDKPKFHSETESFYYHQKPTKPSEAAEFFVFPTRGLEFYAFTPHYLRTHPLVHTRALMELSILFRQSYRFRNVLWLDVVKAKKTALNISCHPDLLLCNSITEEKGRVYIEFENSRTWDLALLEKLHHLTVHPADWYLFLASSEELLQNLVRLVRKILLGEAKVKEQTLFFTPRAQNALSQNVLFGLWTPSFRKSTPPTPFKEIELFRYDHEVFDKQIWVPDSANSGKNPSEVRLSHWQSQGFQARRMGKRSWKLGEILDPYADSFREALEKAME